MPQVIRVTAMLLAGEPPIASVASSAAKSQVVSRFFTCDEYGTTVPELAGMHGSALICYI
jgi:hypothetical protein